MNENRGPIISAIGAVGCLVFFFLAPWVNRSFLGLGFGFSTGLDLASQGRSILFVVPAGALVALALIYAERSLNLSFQALWIGLFLAAAGGIAAMATSFTNLLNIVGPIQFGELAWGFWATGVALVLAPIGAGIRFFEERRAGQ